MADWGPSVAFWVIASALVVSGVLVVTFRNILHAALALFVTLAMVAGIYVTLRADFLALIQVMVYVGAIAVLMLFGIMLTRNAVQGNPSGRFNFVAGALAVLMLGSILLVLLGLGSFTAITPTQELSGIEPIAEGLFTSWLLPFQIAGMMLLAATIGAIVISKED